MAIKDLFTPKWKHSNPKIRKKAITKLSDHKIITTIANHDENLSVRLIATEKLIDLEVFDKITNGDNSALVELEKQIDQKTVAFVALNDSDYFVQRNAINKLVEQKYIEYVAKNTSDSNLKIKVIPKIADPVIIAEFCQSEENEAVREVAVQALKSPLAEQIMNGNFETSNYTQRFIDNSFPTPTDISTNFFFHSFYYSYNESEECLHFSDFPNLESSIRNNNNKEKLIAAKEVMKSNPSFDIAYFHAAKAMLPNKKKAINIIESGLEKSNKKANLFELLGDIEMQNGNYLIACHWYIRSCLNQYKIDNIYNNTPFLYLAYIAEGFEHNAAYSVLVRMGYFGQTVLKQNTAENYINKGRMLRSSDNKFDLNLAFSVLRNLFFDTVHGK